MSTWQSAITAVSTLGGVIATLIVSQRGQRHARRDDRRHAQQDTALAAVTALSEALADHRRAMVEVESRRLDGAAAAEVTAARAASLTTRGAVTGPHVQVGILVPALAAVADEAVHATYALYLAPDPDALETLRRASVAACERLRADAAAVFGAVGVGITD